jgi:uncharacterized protein (DUF488 family)
MVFLLAAGTMVTRPIYTVGHSTRSADEFRELLEGFQVKLLIDVRQFPGSKRFPHFSSAGLIKSLSVAGIAYRHEPELGGRRRAQGDSPNGFWKNSSFRAYADYMATPEFRSALDRLVEVAANQSTAIMCAEAVPWRCHRWLISDALTARGCEVIHILALKSSKPHVLNPNARVSPEGILTYPAETATAGGQKLLW